MKDFPYLEIFLAFVIMILFSLFLYAADREQEIRESTSVLGYNKSCAEIFKV